MPSEFNPQVVIEAKITEDDGTARDKVTRVQHLGALTQLRRFEHFRTPKWLRLLRLTPKGRHYSEIGGMGPAVILGGGWAGRSSFSFGSKRLRSGSGSV